MARSGTPGPVFVELPVDTLYPVSMVEKEISNTGGKKKKNASLIQSVTDMYLQRWIDLSKISCPRINFDMDAETAQEA